MLKEIANKLGNEEQIRHILREEIEKALNKKEVDLQENQQYTSSQSFMISNLSEGAWQEMKKDGARELKPYYNKARDNWSIALSLGYNNNGKRLRKVISAKTEDEVKKKYDEFRKNNTVLEVEKETSDKSQMLLKNYINYVIELSKSRIQPSSLKTKKDNAKYIINFIGNYKMCELNKEIITNYINEFVCAKYTKGGNTDYYSSEIVGKVYQILKKCIETAYEEKVIPINFMEGIEKPKSRQTNTKKKNKPLSDDKIKILTNNLEENLSLKVYFGLLIATGGRPSEILGLHFTDISYKKGTVTINKALTYDVVETEENNKIVSHKIPRIGNVKNFRDGKNPYAHRTCKLPESLLKEIKKFENSIKSNEKIMKLREKNNTVEIMFTGHKQQLVQYQTHSKKLRQYLKRNNVVLEGYTNYAVRHTFVVRLLKMGVDIKTVQILIGDKGAEMVLKIYADIDKEYALEKSNDYSKDLEKTFFKKDNN